MMAAEIAYAYVLGLLSILSPCTFIIIPVMLSDMNTRMKKVLGFLAGIIVTFGVLGILSALTGKLLTNFMGPYLYLFAGIITLAAGLDMTGLISLNIPSLFTRVNPQTEFMKGLLYGGVSLSCVGPLMASVLVYITTKANLAYGAMMMSVFSLGFVTPFLLCGLLITDKKIYRRLERHSGRIRKIGGVLLLLVAAYLLIIAMRGVI